MRSRLAMYLPPFAADYSGVCSALFSLGGMICIHDASGCTGNYALFDEPRWYGSRSSVYCTGLRKTDAALGDDEKLIRKICAASHELKPAFIAIVGSEVLRESWKRSSEFRPLVFRPRVWRALIRTELRKLGIRCLRVLRKESSHRKRARSIFAAFPP